jgi:PAS domain S-box-containing protein
VSAEPVSMKAHSQDHLDFEIALLRERLESAEEMRRSLVAEELDGFVVGGESGQERVVLLETSRMPPHAVLERLPHCVLTVAHSGTILYANQRFASLVGRSLVQLFSTPITDLIAQENRASFERFLVSGVADAVIDVDWLHASGLRFRSRATSVAVGHGYTSFLVNDAQATERNEDAERALEAIHKGEIDGIVVGGDQIMLVADAHRPYRALVDRMQQGAVTVTRDGEVLYVNDRFASMVGRTRDALLGVPLDAALGTHAIGVPFTGAEDDASPREFEITRSDGSSIRVSCTAQRIAGLDAVTLILSDLTEHDRHRRIQERAQRNDQFLAVLAHELRNPLGSIRNAAELLGHSTALRTAESESVELIKRQSATLARLVDDLLDVHRLNDGTILLRREPVDLRDVVANALQMVQSSITAKRQEVGLRVARDPLYVDVDEVRVAQVLGNLLFNACKFTGEGGRIDVVVDRARPDDETEIARVEVIDDGIGIEPSLIEKIFQPYVQAPRKLDTLPEGLGLGLSVARRLAELHGGTLRARSDGPGRGSTFVLELPLCVAPSRASTPPPEAVAQRRLRILVADDDPDSATSLAALLELVGHETHTARNGREALAIADRVRPQVAILDIGMPDVDGYAAARALRERSWARNLILYALTGWGQSTDRERTRAAGFDRHFVKPVTVDEITHDLDSRTIAD